MKTLAEEFLKMAVQPDSHIDLDRAALLVAKIDYPGLDESRYLAQLDDLAARLANRLTTDMDLKNIAGQMNHLLLVEEGFRGNEADYYDPRNSFLNQVLIRKLGIPITLSLIYISVGRRVGLELRGIGFPGHFLTALTRNQQRLLIDPFNRGKITTVEDCRLMLAERFSGTVIFEENHLRPLTAKKFLVRLLRNLKGIYRSVDDQMKFFQMVQWILELAPNSLVELRERGLLYDELGDTQRAARDLNRYLELAGATNDTEEIEGVLARIRNKTSLAH